MAQRASAVRPHSCSATRCCCRLPREAALDGERRATSPQGTASLRKAKKTTVKTCLDNPFVIQWKVIDGDGMHFILQTLEEKIKRIGLKKIETPRKKKRSVTKNQMESKCDASNNELRAEEEAEGHRQVPGWTDMGIRRQLAIGINEVTKALEKNELLLLLVLIFFYCLWSTAVTEVLC
uniref:Uncharacterized protein n=1 Tax=Pavo cristatus TaxID=9049 RepID=A0A8C9FDA9_PAVCR